MDPSAIAGACPGLSTFTHGTFNRLKSRYHLVMRYGDACHKEKRDTGSPQELMTGSAAKRTSPSAKPSPDELFGRAPDHLRRPTDEALRTLQRIHDFEMRSSFLPLRRSFLSRPTPTDPVPPLARLLPRAGLDAVQLKVLLLVLRIAAYGDRYDSPYEANVFAKAIDLDDKRPGGTGDRRIRDALRKLEEHKLLRSPRAGNAGARQRLVPLREDGTDKKYTNPAGRRFPVAESAEGAFFPLQDVFFTKGWICALSGAGITALLILIYASRDAAGAEWTFVAPSQRHDRFGISNDTWLNGLAELAAHGVVTRRDRKTHVGPGPFDFSRQENVRLSLHRLNRSPERAYYRR